MDNNEFTLEESQAKMFSNIEISMETNMDNNEYTLEEPDGVDNEEGMKRERQLFY